MSPRSWMDERAAPHLAAFARVWGRSLASGAPRHGGAVGSPRRAGARLGTLTLRPSQLRTVERIRAAFDEFGGALLADPPGTGKTIVALAVASTSMNVLVFAPSALRAQWERAAGRAQVTIRFVSLEAMSRGAAVEEQKAADLVIIDEAHHVRTPSTRRYAAVAAACVGARVLLLTATPVVNRRGDRDALLALFLGAAASTLDGEAAARCIVRRTETDDDPIVSRPRVRRLPPLDAPLGGGPASIADALAHLPPPFPASDGTAAVALVRLSLAMAWSSSLAALDALLRRRVQRGEALADALGAGRWPTRAALRQWIVTDDATQLAFSELDPAHDHVPDDALEVLRAHLSAVRSLRTTIGPCIAADAAARAEALRALLKDHPTHRMVVFAGHAATIHALRTAMRADAGVVSITGSGHGSIVRAAAGRWSREDVLRALGPLAPPLSTDTRLDDPVRRNSIRVLLATDLLSEGIELQGVGILVHADRAWTPARLEQREGRITRLGTRAGFRTVFITRFRAPAASASLLRLDARLMRKQRIRSRAVRDAESREEVEATIRRWASLSVNADEGSRRSADEGRRSHGSRARSHQDGAAALLALVRIGDETKLVAGWRGSVAAHRHPMAALHSGEDQSSRRWHLSTSPRVVLAVVRLGPLLRRSGLDESRELRAALARWSTRIAQRAVLGPARDARSPLRRRLQQCADRIMRSTPLAHRARRGAELESLVVVVSAVAGAGIERRLSRLLQRSNTDAEIEAGLRDIAATSVLAGRHAARRPTLVALLVATADTNCMGTGQTSADGSRSAAQRVPTSRPL